MQTKELELSVGDAVLVGDRVITLIDIECGEASFRIDFLARGRFDYDTDHPNTDRPDTGRPDTGRPDRARSDFGGSDGTEGFPYLAE